MLIPVCSFLIALTIFYLLYGHQSVVSTRRLYRADHALLLSESRALLAHHREKVATGVEAPEVNIGPDTPEYDKLPATIRCISPVHVTLEVDRLVMTLGVWPRRYAIVTEDTSEMPVDAQEVDEGIWLAH